MTEHVVLFLSILGMALSIIGWGWEHVLKLKADADASFYRAHAVEAHDRWREERRKHPKRGAHGRFEKRATFGTDRPVG